MISVVRNICLQQWRPRATNIKYSASPFISDWNSYCCICAFSNFSPVDVWKKMEMRVIFWEVSLSSDWTCDIEAASLRLIMESRVFVIYYFEYSVGTTGSTFKSVKQQTEAFVWSLKKTIGCVRSVPLQLGLNVFVSQTGPVDGLVWAAGRGLVLILVLVISPRQPAGLQD